MNAIRSVSRLSSLSWHYVEFCNLTQPNSPRWETKDRGGITGLFFAPRRRAYRLSFRLRCRLRRLESSEARVRTHSLASSAITSLNDTPEYRSRSVLNEVGTRLHKRNRDAISILSLCDKSHTINRIKSKIIVADWKLIGLPKIR